MPAKFFIFDATACLPFVILLYHPTMLKLWISLAFCVFLAVLSYFDYTLVVMARRVRSRLAGPVKSGVAWWHRPQRHLHQQRNK